MWYCIQPIFGETNASGQRAKMWYCIQPIFDVTNTSGQRDQMWYCIQPIFGVTNTSGQWAQMWYCIQHFAFRFCALSADKKESSVNREGVSVPFFPTKQTLGFEFVRCHGCTIGKAFILPWMSFPTECEQFPVLGANRSWIIGSFCLFVFC